MPLTREAVLALLDACLLRPSEPRDGAIEVESILADFSFHPARIGANAAAIGELLDELPDPFREDRGGGWTFLNACNDRHGAQWTDYHRDMEALVCLGIAAGRAQWTMPRDMWAGLYGGMPYVTVFYPLGQRPPGAPEETGGGL
jgi:hypothetical protein